MTTTVMGPLAVRPRPGGGFLVEDRRSGAVLPVAELAAALTLAAHIAPRLARGESLAVAYQGALNRLTRGPGEAA
jgi:hypothetical protein